MIYHTPLTIEQIGHYAPSALATSAHHSRSEQYAYVPTVDVVKGLMREGFQPFQAMEATTRTPGKAGYTKHIIRFRQIVSMTQAAEFPEVVLVNSHDGSSAYRIMAGVFRLVCSNGMIVASSQIADISVMHKGNIIDGVIEGAHTVARELPKAMRQIDTWKRMTLTQPEQLAYATAAHELRFGAPEMDETTGKVIDATPIQPAQLLMARRREDESPDLYTTFQRVQEASTKGGMSARGPRGPRGERGRRVTARGIKGIDQDVKINRALWTLTETMHRLKTEAAA